MHVYFKNSNHFFPVCSGGVWHFSPHHHTTCAEGATRKVPQLSTSGRVLENFTGQQHYTNKKIPLCSCCFLKVPFGRAATMAVALHAEME